MHVVVIVIAKYFVIIPVLAWSVVFVRTPRQRWLRFAGFSILAAIVTIILVKLATTLHQDPRPFIRDKVHPYFASSTDNGFPSDHTTFSTLIALVVLRYHRKLGLALLLVAILIGTARVISGVHHGQDIVGGLAVAGLGAALAFAVESLYERLQKDRRPHAD